MYLPLTFQGKKLVVDIGGTNIKFAVIENKQIFKKWEVKTPMGFKEINEMIKKEVKRSNAKKIGIATRGIVKGNYVEDLDHLGCFTFDKHINEAFVSIVNDAKAAVIAEHTLGAGKGFEKGVLMTLGTGTGISGFEGDDTFSTEGAHITIKNGGPKCICGHKGCLELYTSVTALKEMTKKLVDKKPAIFGEDILKSLFVNAKNGNKECQKVINSWQKNIALSIDKLNIIFTPDVFILGGGISRQSEYLIEPIRHMVANKSVIIKKAEFDNDSGIIGAAIAVDRKRID